METPYFGPPADVFQIGVVLFFMIMNRNPFTEGAYLTDKLYSYIANGQPAKFWETHLKNCNKQVSFELKDLINRLFQFDYTRRITLEQIKKHPWFKGEIPSVGEREKEME